MIVHRAWARSPGVMSAELTGAASSASQATDPAVRCGWHSALGGLLAAVPSGSGSSACWRMMGALSTPLLRLPPGDQIAHRLRGLTADKPALCRRGGDPRPPGRGAARRTPGAQPPIVDALQAWLSAQLERISGKSSLAEAIRYALRHWNGLGLFLDHGRVELDTNAVERSIRPLALGRKNSLFAGSDEGASCCSSHHASIIQEDFVGGRRAAGVASAARRLAGERRRSTDRPVE